MSINGTIEKCRHCQVEPGGEHPTWCNYYQPPLTTDELAAIREILAGDR